MWCRRLLPEKRRPKRNQPPSSASGRASALRVFTHLPSALLPTQHHHERPLGFLHPGTDGKLRASPQRQLCGLLFLFVAGHFFALRLPHACGGWLSRIGESQKGNDPFLCPLPVTGRRPRTSDFKIRPIHRSGSLHCSATTHAKMLNRLSGLCSLLTIGMIAFEEIQ